MERRSFLRKLFLAPVAAAIGVKLAPEFTWDKTRIDWVPSNWKPTPAQLAFLNKEELFFYGIPYHQYNGSTGEWLGFQRANHTVKTAMGKLIESLDKDAESCLTTRKA